MSTVLRSVSSSTENPVFNDPVYYGYFPTNPSPDFSLPKPLNEMNIAEKARLLETFAKRQEDALEEEAKNILRNHYPRDQFNRAMIVAEARGDEYLAEEILKRDHADTVTENRLNMPTRTGGSRTLDVQRLGKMLAVLFSLPTEVKQALLRGNFPALFSGANPTMKRMVPMNTTTRSTTPFGQHRPYIYILHLVTSSLNNPTMRKMREIISFAKAYLDRVRATADGTPMRVIKAPNYRASDQNLVQVMQIDAAKMRNDKFFFKDALHQASLRSALQSNRNEVPCLYITTNNQLRGMHRIVDTTEQRLDTLEQNGWNAASSTPLPSTIASCGWTADPGRRRSEYESHTDINGKIRLFDAISRHLQLRQKGLDWQCLLMPWNIEAVPMAEHIGHVLGSTYVAQGGMNGDAAGYSTKSKSRVPAAYYRELEQKLLNKPHWVQNRDGTDSRNTTCLTGIEALPDYLDLSREVSDSSLEVQKLETRIKNLEEVQLENDMQEIGAMVDRNQVCGQLLDDLNQLDKLLQELKLIHDTIYSVEGVSEFISEQDVSSVEASQVVEATLQALSSPVRPSSQLQIRASSPLQSPVQRSEAGESVEMSDVPDSAPYDEDYDVTQ